LRIARPRVKAACGLWLVAVAASAAPEGFGPGDAGTGGGAYVWSPLERDPFEFRGAHAAGPGPRRDASRAEIARLADEAQRLIEEGQADRAEETARRALAHLRGAEDARDVALRLRLEGYAREASRCRHEACLRREFDRMALEVRGIIWDEDNPVALVLSPEDGSKVARPGDLIGGAKVDRIVPGKVFFRFGGVEIAVELSRPSAGGGEQ
jgi:hypothetical protein